MFNRLTQLRYYIIIYLLSIMPAVYAATPIRIAAAENFYGNIAQQIGGHFVTVTSIMQNPNQDPHLLSASFASAKALAEADLIIYNGIDYDPWMPKLLSANRQQPKKVIVVADLLHKTSGANPHLWYNPQAMAIFVKTLTAQLSELMPEQTHYFQEQATQFNQQLSAITEKISALRTKYQGTPVIATEPVFGYMAEAIGLNMQGEAFQLSVMNDTEPSVAAIRDFEDQLKQHKVRVFIYNNQVISPRTEHMKKLAEQQHIPVIGVSETQPLAKNYVAWMLQELDDLQRALEEENNS